jgi:hypothetical protein
MPISAIFQDAPNGGVDSLYLSGGGGGWFLLAVVAIVVVGLRGIGSRIAGSICRRPPLMPAVARRSRVRSGRAGPDRTDGGRRRRLFAGAERSAAGRDGPVGAGVGTARAQAKAKTNRGRKRPAGRYRAFDSDGGEEGGLAKGVERNENDELGGTETATLLHPRRRDVVVADNTTAAINQTNKRMRCIILAARCCRLPARVSPARRLQARSAEAVPRSSLVDRFSRARTPTEPPKASRKSALRRRRSSSSTSS